MTSPDAYAGAGTTAIASWRRICRTDYHGYSTRVLKDDRGNPIEQDSIHRVMHAHVDACWDAGLHAAVLAPFAHGKSMSLVVGRTTWEIGRDPSIRTKIVCNNDSRAMERVMGIGSILRSPAYRLAFPEVRKVSREKAIRLGMPEKWTQHEIFLDRPGQALDPSVHAAGVLSGGTGGRCDLIVFDDVVDRKNALDDPALRPKVIGNFEDVWMQRLEPHGRALYVGTAWHQADLTHTLFDRPGWCTLRIWVSDDFDRLNMEVFNPPPSYPLPRAANAPPSPTEVGWVQVDSSNIAMVRRVGGDLEVQFHSGAAYRYDGVPEEVFQELVRAKSPGSYLNAVVKPGYKATKLLDSVA